MNAIAVLLWKEWRERRGEAVTLLAVGVLLPFALAWLVELAKSVHPLGGIAQRPEGVLVLFWGLVGLLAAAPAMASERASRSLDFLLAQPVARTRMWLWKLVSVFLLAAVIIGASWAAYHVVMPSRWRPWLEFPIAVPYTLSPSAMLGFIGGWPLLFFTAGLLASVLVEGTVLAITLATVIALPLSVLLTEMCGGPELVHGAPAGALCSGAMLVTSYLAFCGREHWPGRLRPVVAWVCLTWLCALVTGIGVEVLRNPDVRARRRIAELREFVGPDQPGRLLLMCRDQKGRSRLWWGTPEGHWRREVRCSGVEVLEPLGVPLFTTDQGREAVFEPLGGEVRVLKKPWLECVKQYVATQTGAGAALVELFSAPSPTHPGSHLICFARIAGRDWYAVQPWRLHLLRLEIPPGAVPLGWSNAYTLGLVLYQTADGLLGEYREGAPKARILSEIEGAAEPGGSWKVWALARSGFVVQRSGSSRIQLVYEPESRQLRVLALNDVAGELMDAGRFGSYGEVGLVVRRANDSAVDLWECRLDEKAHRVFCRRLIEGAAGIVSNDWGRGAWVAYGARESEYAFIVTEAGGTEQDGDLWLVRKGKAEKVVSGGIRAEPRQCVMVGLFPVVIRNGRELWEVNPLTHAAKRIWP